MTLEIINPATEALITSLETDTATTVEKKLQTLRQGQLSWKQRSVLDRLTCIERFGHLVQQNKNELAQILTSETGKPLQQSLNEINGAQNRIEHLQEHAEIWLQDEEMVKMGNTHEKIVYEPLGVIGNISAWNFPYNVGFNVFLYALVSGNAVLYKPSEFASLTGMKFRDLLWEAGVPQNVFEITIGGADVGKAMLAVDLDGYFFTGSYQTGKSIAQTVAPKLVPVQLELGGKDPLYVMNDVADVKQAAINAAEGAFYNNGQSCCAVERIYVHQDIYQEFISAFVEEVKGYTIGSPNELTTFIGPLTRAPQLQVIQHQVEDAVAKGATVATGGQLLDQKGYYIEPTVLLNVDHSMKVMMEESFGPIIGIQQVSDDAEALALMQDTPYGLTSAIFSKDQDRAQQLFSQLNTGTVYWNCCDRVSPNVPWSGRGNSGLGSTLSYLGIRAFVQPKAYHLRQG